LEHRDEVRRHSRVVEAGTERKGISAASQVHPHYMPAGAIGEDAGADHVRRAVASLEAVDHEKSGPFSLRLPGGAKENADSVAGLDDDVFRGKPPP